MPDELLMIARLLLAGALGGLIGFQRERVGKEAGIRTLALISIGSALFTVLSISGFDAPDPSRVAANIVVGIGFLGAGAIIHRDQGVIEGMTTAATIWVAAAIGIAAGTGLSFIAVAATAIVLVVLVLPHVHSDQGSTKK